MRTRLVVSMLVTLTMVAVSCTRNTEPFGAPVTVPTSDPLGTLPVDDTVEPTTTALPPAAPVLEPSTATPAHPVRLTHPSLTAGAATTVTLTDGAVVIEYPLTPTADGAVVFTAPPRVDLTTGRPSPGQYTVSIPAAPSATLMIGDLPPALEGPPGTVTRTVLAQAIADLYAAQPHLDRLGTELGLDTTDIDYAVEMLLADLGAHLLEFDTTGTLHVTAGIGGTTQLTVADLELMDRLLTAYLDGLVELLEQQPTEPEGFRASSPLAEQVTEPEGTAPPSTTQDRLDRVRRLQAQVNGGATALTGTAAMLVTAIGVIAGGAALGTSALFAFLAGVGTTVVLGTAAEGFAAIEAAINGDDWEFGQAFGDTMLSAFLNLGVTIGAEVSMLVNIGSFLYTGSAVRTSLYDLVCIPPVPDRFADFCDRQATDIAEALPLTIKRVWFSPERIPPGLTGTLYIPILVGPTHDVGLNVVWGDGAPDHTSAVTRSGVLRIDHAFNAEADSVFRIEVHAIDAEGNEAFENTRVSVSSDFAMTLGTVTSPAQLTTYNGYTWTFELTNGRKPYTITADFGDGSGTQTFVIDKTGILSFDHVYERAGEFPIRVAVTDELGGTASSTVTGKVREPVAIGAIDGPAALDPGEEGAWTMQIEPGWGPFDVEISWGDGSEPYRTTTDGPTTATHSYLENGTYTVTAFVTSAVSLSAETGTVVVVPRAPITWTATVSQTCASSDGSYDLQAPATGEVTDGGRTINMLATETGIGVSGAIAPDGSFVIDTTIPQPQGAPSPVSVTGQVVVDHATSTVTGSFSGIQTWPELGLQCTFSAQF